MATAPLLIPLGQAGGPPLQAAVKVARYKDGAIAIQIAPEGAAPIMLTAQVPAARLPFGCVPVTPEGLALETDLRHGQVLDGVPIAEVAGTDGARHPVYRLGAKALSRIEMLGLLLPNAPRTRAVSLDTYRAVADGLTLLADALAEGDDRIDAQVIGIITRRETLPWPDTEAVRCAARMMQDPLDRNAEEFVVAAGREPDFIAAGLYLLARTRPEMSAVVDVAAKVDWARSGIEVPIEHSSNAPHSDEDNSELYQGMRG